MTQDNIEKLLDKLPRVGATNDEVIYWSDRSDGTLISIKKTMTYSEEFVFVNRDRAIDLLIDTCQHLDKITYDDLLERKLLGQQFQIFGNIVTKPDVGGGVIDSGIYVRYDGKRINGIFITPIKSLRNIMFIIKEENE